MAHITNLAGANPARRTPEAEFALGQVGIGDDGKSYLYVGPAATAVAYNNAAATVDAAFAVNDTAGGTYTPGGATAFAIGDYGWVFKSTSPF